MAWLHSQFSRWSVVAVLASPVFWGLDHCMLSHRRTIIQMVTRRFASREFAGRSSFGIKFANSSDAMPAWSVHRFFSLQGFPTFVGHISPYRWARNFDIVKLKFSFTLQSCWIITHILTAFSIPFFTQFVKKKPAIYSLVCIVRSLLLTTCSLIVQTSSTIWQFLWLNGQSTVKIDAWAPAQTVYAFIFVKE